MRTAYLRGTSQSGHRHQARRRPRPYDAEVSISAVMPQDDDQGWPTHLEVCTSCDLGDATRPAAGILVQFFADGGGHDESLSQEAAQLLTEWTREAMAAHRWYWHEKPPDQL
ncbi:DUF6300 family protein [Streptomyces sp. EKR5.2]|uniref:DUF6300 family protein n=1 Tax=Streptomyces sp. EKR5.2 TaxID=3461014 RepID=UPI0040423759